jgi:hypothetical protein
MRGLEIVAAIVVALVVGLVLQATVSSALGGAIAVVALIALFGSYGRARVLALRRDRERQRARRLEHQD